MPGQAACWGRARAAMLLAVANVLALLVLLSPALASALAPRCTVSHLRLSRVRGEGALSHVYWDESLRNVGAGTCRLSGYPRVRLLDRHGHPINVRVGHTTPYPVRTVVLYHGQRAFFTFGFVTSGPCLPHFFSAYGLAVSPPHDGGQLVAHTGRFDVCSPSVGGAPGVSPVRSTLELSPPRARPGLFVALAAPMPVMHEAGAAFSVRTSAQRSNRKGKRKAKGKKKPKKKPKKKKGKKKKGKPKKKAKPKKKPKRKKGAKVTYKLTASPTSVVVPGSSTLTVTTSFEISQGKGKPPLSVPYQPGPSTQEAHFTTDFGTLSSSTAALNGNGSASVTLSSPTPGVATVTVTIPSLNAKQLAKQCKQPKHGQPCKKGKRQAPVTAMVSFINKYNCTGAQTTLFDNSNGEIVSSGASAPTFSTSGHTFCLTSITTYHWNEEHGAVPGSLGLTTLASTLQGKGMRVGPWKATSSSGQNGAPNVNWYVYPPREPPAVIDGTYSCYDSDPSTWSWNEASGGLGFCTIQVIPAVLATK